MDALALFNTCAYAVGAFHCSSSNARPQSPSVPRPATLSVFTTLQLSTTSKYKPVRQTLSAIVKSCLLAPAECVMCAENEELLCRWQTNWFGNYPHSPCSLICMPGCRADHARLQSRHHARLQSRHHARLQSRHHARLQSRPCQAAEQTSCQAAEQTSCQTAEQTSCQAAEQTSCQAVEQTSCQAAEQTIYRVSHAQPRISLSMYVCIQVRMLFSRWSPSLPSSFSSSSSSGSPPPSPIRR